MSLGWDTPQSAVLVGTRIWSGVFWLGWESVEVRLDQHLWVSGGGDVPQALTLPGEARFIAWGTPFLGESDWARIIFGNARHVWATALCPDPPKKSIVLYSSGYWDGKQIPTRAGAQSLNVTGRKHTLVNRVGRYTGVSWFRLAVGRGRHSFRTRQDRHPRVSGGDHCSL